MGRITVFSAEDLHSKQVMAALQARSIPFTEISLLSNPHKRHELKTLNGQCSVPQVFFNTRHVGGVDETLKELREWDRQTSKYATPLARYQREIASTSDPTHPVFSIPEQNKSTELETKFDPPRIAMGPLPIRLPDGTTTSVEDITARLKNSLPATDNVVNNVVYKLSFTGRTLLSSFQQALGISEEMAVDFGNHLLEEKIIHPLTSDTAFFNSVKAIYRLQCFMRPDALNSYRIWKEASASSDHTDVVKRLDRMMHQIEIDMINEHGLMDFAKALASRKFSEFEDAVCELQVVRVGALKLRERFVFGINVYNLMIKYAFIKLGVPTTEAARHALVSKVKFTVDSQVYTLDQWIHRFVMIGGKTKHKPLSLFAPSVTKPKIDLRVHFAMNMGAFMGSSKSPPFRIFTTQNFVDELDVAAQIFLEDEGNLLVDKDRQQVIVSKVVSWNRGDFSETDRGLLKDFRDCLVGTKKLEVQEARSNKNTKVVYVDPPYMLNACNFKTFEDSNVKADVKGLKAVFYRFRPAPKPENEELRVATLRNLAILDTMPEERFDRITRMVKAAFDVPLVFISLVDSERQWFKSKQWYCTKASAVPETDRAVSFCGHTILGSPRVPLWIEDATEDSRFADNPMVTGPLGIRFYAGCPLSVPAVKTGELVNIGVLCVKDTKPRKYDEKDVLTLRAYAKQIEDEILQRRASVATKEEALVYAETAVLAG